MTTTYSGYAFKPNENELRKKITDRYKEIKPLEEKIKLTRFSAYKKGTFTASVPPELQDQLNEMDILILSDHGNLCFGGSCEHLGDGNYKGHYWTD